MLRILYIQYTNPALYPPLEHSSRILADGGSQVLFLGTRVFGASALEFPDRQRIEVRTMAFCPGGWRQKLHYLRFAIWTLYWSLRWRPDWIYASDLLSCPAALVLSFLPGVSVIYHEHDTPSSSGSRFFLQIAKAARRKLAHRAELCVLPNQERVGRFAAETSNGSNVSCVWNCPSLEDAGFKREPKNSGILAVYYHGNLGPEVLPPTIIPAIAEMNGAVRLIVAGYETIGQEGYLNSLKASAALLGVEQSFEFLGAVPRHQLAQIARQCDVGLGLISQRSLNLNIRHLVGASNKMFDYLACGLALLVSDRSDFGESFIESGYGLSCEPNNPESIASALRWFLNHPLEMRAMGERGRERILADWNYEATFAPVLEVIKGLHEYEPTNAT